MSKCVRINFCDMWPGFLPEKHFLYNEIEKVVPVEIHDKPDYVFCSVYGKQHFSYNDCIKILYTGENIVPDFNYYDYAIGFHHLNFQDRYLRLPLAFSNPLIECLESSRPATPHLAGRRFCSFVYGNSRQCDPIREKFYLQLSGYREIEAAGKVRNNIGRIVPYHEKIEFTKQHKFSIAFENSSVDGYVTEKLVDAFLAHTVPVYFGCRSVADDFNLDALILVQKESDFEPAISRIKKLDTNVDSYLEMLSKPAVHRGKTKLYYSKLNKFLTNIFKQPITSAIRRPKYGGIINYLNLHSSVNLKPRHKFIFCQAVDKLRSFLVRHK